MRRGRLLAAMAIAGALARIAVACGSDESADPPPLATDGSPTAEASTDSPTVDPRCEIRPVALPDHPFAVTQDSGQGKNLRNVKGWNGQVYFGYGDLNANTGPIEIASYEPVSKAWNKRLLLTTHSIERFVEVGSELWTTCGQGMQGAPCEYASGTAGHAWTSHHFTFSIHVMDAVERFPGEAYLAGSSLLDGSALYDAGPLAGAFLWRTIDGGPFQQVFPEGLGALETGGGPFMSVASFRGVLYAVTGGSVWTRDSTNVWFHARSPNDQDDPLLFGDFVHPLSFADRLVFGISGGYIWAFDGKTSKPLGIRSFQTPSAIGFTEAPVVIFESTEGHFLAVDERGDVLESKDLVSFHCIGKAPSDVRSVGSLGGTVYFGGANGHAYAYAQRSW